MTGNQISARRKQGGQPENKNAAGNCGGAPLGNKNAVKHGLYETILLPTPLHKLVVHIMECERMEPTLDNFYEVRAQLIEEYRPELMLYFRR